MTGRGWILGGLLLLQGCGDDGHVVGDMSSGGSGGSDSAANSSTGSGTTNVSSSAANTESGGSGTTTGATSSTTSNVGGMASGGTSTGGAATDGATAGGSSAGGSSAGGSSAGGASVGGASGTGGGTTTGTGGTGGQCPDGQTWCPGCRVDEGSCVSGTVCPALPCQACSAAVDEADCATFTNCHPVYQDPHNCRCATLGCCAQYVSCAVGATVDCEGANVQCDSVTPYCESPAFVVSYTANCYEGCVKPEVCATPPAGDDVCPCEADGCSDGQQMCLMGDTCVVADGIQGNGICRASDGTCAYCVCASPDTPIATATGDRAIRELRVGDLVYSVDHEATVLVPIRRVNRTAVIRHRVLRVEFADGSHFEMSGGHPTADGQPLAELRVGQRIGRHRVSRVTEIAYQHPFTYDILPDSDTGSYFADGVLMGSTLAPGFTAEPTAREVTDE